MTDNKNTTASKKKKKTPKNNELNLNKNETKVEVETTKGLDLKQDPEFRHQYTTELLNKIPTKTLNINLDEVLDAVKELDSVCDFRKCKVKTNLIGTDCNLCDKRYCCKHILPEIHGCSDAIKKAERENFLRPVPIKTIQKQEDIEKSRKRLKNKLQEMKLSRKAKTTEISTKKK